jgi:hypothetical protein
MAMSSDLTLGTVTYSSTVIKSNSTLRANAARPIEDPEVLTISHEIAKNGKVSSVILIDDNEALPCTTTCNTPTTSNVRAMFKLQYNPLDGRAGLVTSITYVINQLQLALNDATVMAKFVNKEH